MCRERYCNKSGARDESRVARLLFRPPLSMQSGIRIYHSENGFLMKSVRRLFLPAALFLVVGLVLGIKVESSGSDSNTLQQLDKLHDAFLIVHSNYVDEVDAEDAAEYAIEGMLEELDPHSVYISPEEIEEVQESIKGSFGGVGIWFEVLEDTARVISTVPEGPSEAAGVMAGDRIVAVDDSNAVGFTDRDVQKHLKGPIGTEVEMTVRAYASRSPSTSLAATSRCTRWKVTICWMSRPATSG